MTPAEEHFHFYYEMGLTITQWASVEMTLRDIVVNCASAPDRRIISIGYYSIENFRSKLQFCDNLLTERFESSPHFSEWAKLYERLKRASTKRNKLAHRTVLVFPNAPAGRRYSLVDWLDGQFTAKSKKHSRLSDANPPQGAIYLLDVMQFQIDFSSLFIDLANFSAKLAGHAPTYPPELQVPRKPPTLKEMRSRIDWMLPKKAD